MPPGMRRVANGMPIHEAKVYRPTWEEFKDFNNFIKYIEADGAGEAGICKVIPPEGWVPRKAGYNIDGLDFVIDTPVLQKFCEVGVNGTFQTQSMLQYQKMTIKEYYNLCHEPNNLPPHHDSHEDLERKYWNAVRFGTPPIYGCDVAAPLSDPDLDVWNISKLGCILDIIKKNDDTDIKGVLTPYLYFGMWKATFSWHIEDLDLFAINMVHHGAPKTWYCVPPKYGHLLEKAARAMFPAVASGCSNFMRHKTCLISPKALGQCGVPYQKIVQEEREIIITFPYAYHQGFNHGFNIAESTNFAMPSWVEYGKRSKPCDCGLFDVQFSMDLFVKEFQPEKYEDWIANRDIAPHPMDPPDVVKKVKLQLENPEAYAKLIGRKRKNNSDMIHYTKSVSDKKYRTYDVYQHHELANVLVHYNPETKKIRRGAARLAKFFDKPNVPDLVEKGYLIKVNVVKFLAKESPKSPSVKPKRIKINNDAGADGPKLQQNIVEQVVNLLKLRHVQSGMKIKVFPGTFKPAFNVPKELMAITDINNLKSLVLEGAFTIEGEFPTQMKRLANSPVHAPNFLSCNLYLTKDTNLPVKVTLEKEIVLDAHLPHVKNLMEGTTLKALLRENKLIYFTKMSLTKRQPFEAMSNDVLDDGFNPADLNPDFDLTNDFVMENDPEDCQNAEDQFSGIESCKIEKRKVADPKKSISRNVPSPKTPAKKTLFKDKTKEIIAYLDSKFSCEDEERLFSLNDLANATKLRTETTLQIMDVFEDLRLISQGKSSDLEEDNSWVWKGIKKSDLNDTIHDLAQLSGNSIKTNHNLVKSVLRQTIKKLLSAKKGEAVLLKYSSEGIPSKFKLNNRIPIAMGVLEGLDLLRSIPDQSYMAFWDYDNPYQVLPEKQEDISLSTCTTTGNDGSKSDSEEIRKLESFEVQEIVQKTKEVVTGLMSRYLGEEGRCSFSLNDIETETSLHPEFVLFILEMLEEIEIIKKESCDETNSTRFTWMGTGNSLSKISLIIITPRLHQSLEFNAETVLKMVIKRLHARQQGIDFSNERFNRLEKAKLCKEFFIAVGILDALSLVHISDKNVVKWISATPSMSLPKCTETTSPGSSSFQPTTCSISESEKITKSHVLLDVVTKTKDIVQFLKDGNFPKFSLANLEENGIKEPLLIHHILDILEWLRIISKDPKASSDKHYIWRGVKTTSLLASFSSIMLKKLKGEMKMEMKAALKIVLNRSLKLKKGNLKKLHKQAMKSGKQIFCRNVNIVVGVLDGLGLVEHAAGDALHAKWLNKKLR